MSFLKFITAPQHAFSRGSRALGFGLALALMLSTACGESNMTRASENKPDAGGDTFSDVEEEGPDEALFSFAMSSAAEVCTKIFECCSESERKNDLGVGSETVEQCADQSGFLSFAFGYGQFDDSIKAGRIVVDTGMAELCLNSIQATECANFSSITSIDDFIPGCRAVFLPQVEKEGLCEIDQDCKTGSCLLNESTGELTCQTLPGDGEPCPDLNCADGLYCDSFLFDPPACVSQREEGESCLDNSQCLSNFCAPDGQNNLTCQTKAAICSGP